jgi:hypothetical protein
VADNTQNLVLQIDANLELLRRSLNDADRAIADFDRRTNNAVGNVDGAFGRMQKGGVLALSALSGAIAGFGVTGLVQLGRGILQFADDLDAAATQANVSIERYQTLRESLRALELTTDQTDQVLNRLSETLGAVQAGTAAGGVIAALDRMGATSKILNGEIDTTDELLDAIAASASTYATEAQFTADVVDILGRKVGVDLAAAIRDGGVALKEGEQAFRDAGNVISEEYVAELAAANEEIDRFVSASKSRLTIWAAETIRLFRAVNFDILDIARGLDRVLLAGTPAAAGVSPATRSAAPVASAVGGGDIVVVGKRPPAVPSRAVTAARASRSVQRRGGNARQLSPAELREQGVASPGISLGDNPVAGAERLLQTMLEVRDVTAEIEASKLANSLEAAQNFGRDISSNLAQAIVYGQSIGDALVASFRAAAAEALANGLFDLLLGRDGKGGIVSSLITAFGSSFGGARANGGPVMGGKAYLVGERGPELFIPRASGGIVPNGAMGGGAALTFDLRGAVMTEDLLRQMQGLAMQAGVTAIGISRSDMAARDRSRLPRSLGA